MKELKYYIFKHKVYSRTKNLRKKQLKRYHLVRVVRYQMIRRDQFAFDLPRYVRVDLCNFLNIQYNDDTMGLLIRLVAPIYDDPYLLFDFSKNFPL